MLLPLQQFTINNLKNREWHRTVLPLCAAIMCTVALPSVTWAQGNDTKNKLTWDYGVAPSAGTICQDISPKGWECIESFVLAYQTGKNKFKKVSTLRARDICVKRTQPGGGWTCTATIPPVPALKKQKTVTWAVGAVTNTGLKSGYSNTVTKENK